jgi:hypothetical protein
LGAQYYGILKSIAIEINPWVSFYLWWDPIRNKSF